MRHGANQVARKSRPSDAITGSVSIEVGGETYTGDYSVRDGWMALSTRVQEQAAAAVHEGAPWHGLAKLLMHEIIGEAMRRGAIEKG